MKKLTNIVLSLSMLFLASSFAIDTDEVSEKVKSVFNKSFTTASDVKWKKDNNIYFVSFKIAEKNCSAIYSEAGELMSMATEQPLSLLPAIVSLALEDKYSAYKIHDKVSETISNNETTYFITAENEKYKIKLRSDIYGNLIVEEKIKK